LNWCGLNSALALGVRIGANTVLEYCTFPHPATSIGSSCILNNLRAGADRAVEIPDGVVMQTLPIWDEVKGEAAWVTSFFGTQDDFKRTSRSGREVCLRKVPLLSRVTFEQLWPQANQGPGSPLPSLWTARLLPVASSPEQSLKSSLEVLRALIAPVEAGESKVLSALWQTYRMTSWEEALKNKDLSRIQARPPSVLLASNL
jgi:hypothetical protein